MATMNISLSDSLKDYAQNRTQSGDYSNPSDYVRSLIRKDKEKAEARKHIEALLQEGFDSGEPIPVNDEYWANLKTELQAELDHKK